MRNPGLLHQTPPWRRGCRAMNNDWTDEIDRRLAAIETRHAVDEVHRSNVADRLNAIEDTLKWLVRLIIGGLLMAALTYAVQGGLMQ